MTITPPPPRQPTPVRADQEIRGQRLVIVWPEGPQYDRRAVSNAEVGADARLYVQVCTDEDWYLWTLTGVRPPVRDEPIERVFLE